MRLLGPRHRQRPYASLGSRKGPAIIDCGNGSLIHVADADTEPLMSLHRA
jgi:hypothetical protein